MSQLTVQFFASLRELLGQDSIQLSWPEALPVTSLIDAIGAELGREAAELLTHSDILVAINQAMVDRDHPVHSGDEVAFLPPVTGG
jgi:molybdopterin synthase sulfur carrier subunit